MKTKTPNFNAKPSLEQHSSSSSICS